MEALTALRWGLLALAAINVGLTVWHSLILRRAWRYQADTARLHDEAERLLGEVQALDGRSHVVGSNGYRRHVEEVAEP